MNAPVTLRVTGIIIKVCGEVLWKITSFFLYKISCTNYANSKKFVFIIGSHLYKTNAKHVYTFLLH